MGRPPMPVGQWGKITVTEQYLDGSSGKWVAGERPGRTVPARFTARTRVRDLDGVVRQVEATDATRTRAEQRLREQLATRVTPTTGAVTAGSRMTSLAAQWLAEVGSADVRDTTKDLYRRNMAAYVEPRLGGLRVREVTVPTVDRWLREITAEHGAANAKTSRTCLRGMLALAVRHGAITANPVREAAPIKRGEPRKQASALTREEEARVRAYLAADSYSASLGLGDLVTFMLGTGVRVGEALALTWDKVDLTEGQECVSITATVEQVSGQPLVVKERTKTMAGRREVPLTATVADTLRVRRDTQPVNSAGLVFPSVRGTVADRANTLKRLRRAFDACGLHDVTSHGLRKTRATRLLDANVPLREVADLLGHADITMTLNTYTGRRMVTRASAIVE